MGKEIIKKNQNNVTIENTTKLINRAISIATLINDGLILKKDVTYIGIDFGTSTTVVSLATGDPKEDNLQSKAIELNQKLFNGAIYKSYKIPTMVAWYNNTLLIGEGANEYRQKLKPGRNLWHSFKMELGEDAGVKYPESELNNEKIKILNPKDVTTLFFKYLKTQIEKYVKENNLPNTIEYAVSIPASFEANQRKDLLDSLHANNMMLQKQTLIDEPNAAFLSYISHQDFRNQVHVNDEYPTNILVFDFGAGTCDISILEIANTAKGYVSKNLAISRFDALGGNDIDKKIALDILFPRFLTENDIEEGRFKKKEKSIILSKLEKAAELLKIQVSEKFDLIKHNDNFEKISRSNEQSLSYKVELKTKNGNFILEKPSISNLEFTSIMESFTTSNIEDYEDPNVKTIFKPILSALEKSNLSIDDIDYVLFIGGSSKNPLIQNAIKKYFEDSTYLIPSDLQAHVSAGAAIHSLMYNGFGKNLIDPITSEPILAMVKDGNNEILTVLLKAGTTIPCQDIIIDNLRPQKANQKIIEIPLYIGSKEKLLHNIKINCKNFNGFAITDKIKIFLSINSDKMLLVKATINDNQAATIEPLNPFSNKLTNIKDIKKYEIEKEYNKSKASNNGKDNLTSLKNLYEGYNELGFMLDAAETLEDLYNKFDYGSLNNIGVAYSNAGDEQKAMEFYQKDFKQKPSETSAYNIAMKYKYADKNIYEEWLRKSLDIDPNYEHSLYYYGILKVERGDEKEGLKMIRKAFKSWKSEYESGLFRSNLSNFISCAKYLEEYNFANKLERENQKSKKDFSEFSSDNLIKMKY